MKITYIHQHFKPPEQSGAGRPYEFATRLARSGHAVTMVCAGSVDTTYHLDGIDVVQLGVRYDNSMSVAERIASFVRFMIRATRTTVSVDADVVLASSTPLTVVVPGLVGARRQRARFVLEVRDLWPEAPIELGMLPRPLHVPAKMLERVGYRSADHVIALSPGMAEGVTAVTPTASVSVVPNASDIRSPDPDERERTRAALGVAEDQLLFVYAGSLGRIYDPGWLVRLAAVLADLGHRLVVAGDGSEREDAMAQLASRGIDAPSVFVGPIPRRDVAALLGAADVAVSSVLSHRTLRHASINKIFDALGAGLPVLMNHGGWLADEVVRHGAGEVVHEPTPDALASFLDRAWRTTASESSRELARGEFDRELLFEKFASAVTGS